MLKKTVPILVILLILGGMYFLARKYNLSAKSSTVPLTQRTSLSDSVKYSQKKSTEKTVQTVQNFYKSYTHCMKQATSDNTSNQSANCLKNNSYISQKLMNNLSLSTNVQKLSDPVICAQNLPQSTQVVGASSEMSGTASADVVATYGAGSTVNIQAELTNENGKWKVDNIICPRM